MLFDGARVRRGGVDPVDGKRIVGPGCVVEDAVLGDGVELGGRNELRAGARSARVRLATRRPVLLRRLRPADERAKPAGQAKTRS